MFIFHANEARWRERERLITVTRSSEEERRRCFVLYVIWSLIEGEREGERYGGDVVTFTVFHILVYPSSTRKKGLMLFVMKQTTLVQSGASVATIQPRERRHLKISTTTKTFHKT